MGRRASVAGFPHSFVSASADGTLFAQIGVSRRIHCVCHIG